MCRELVSRVVGPSLALLEADVPRGEGDDAVLVGFGQGDVRVVFVAVDVQSVGFGGLGAGGGGAVEGVEAGQGGDEGAVAAVVVVRGAWGGAFGEEVRGEG